MVGEWELVLITLATMAALFIIDLIRFIFRGYRRTVVHTLGSRAALEGAELVQSRAKIAPVAIGQIQKLSSKKKTLDAPFAEPFIARLPSD